MIPTPPPQHSQKISVEKLTLCTLRHRIGVRQNTFYLKVGWVEMFNRGEERSRNLRRKSWLKGAICRESMREEKGRGWWEEVRSNLQAVKQMHAKIRGCLVFRAILFLGTAVFNRKCNLRYKFSFILLKSSSLCRYWIPLTITARLLFLHREFVWELHLSADIFGDKIRSEWEEKRWISYTE